MIDIDKLYKSLAILKALKSNVASTSSVDEIYVTEFRNVLDKLRSIGLQMDDFDVPGTEVKPRQTSINMFGVSTYSSEKYVDKYYLLTKIDSVLNYLNLLLEKRPPELGFSKPDKQ
jgi:hypothetical protein